MRDSPFPRLAAGALVVIAAVIAHGHALSAPFVFDDVHAIAENPHVRHLSVAAPPESALSGRPLAALSFSATWALGGDDPWIHHAANLALLTVAGLVLLDLTARALFVSGRGVRTRGASLGLATAAALLWVVHPLNSEVVHYAVQRTELLWGLFALIALDASLRSRQRRGWLIPAVAASALAMASKETAIVVPVLVIGLDAALPEGDRRPWMRSRRGGHAAFAATWFVLAALMAGTPRAESVGFGHGISAAGYLADQAVEIANYLRLVVWPAPLLIDYGTPWPWREHWPLALACGMGLGIVLAIGLALAPRRAGLAFLVLAPFVVLAPTSSVVPIVTEVAAERRMLLPLAPILLLAVLGLDALRGRASIPRALGAAALALATGALAWTSARRADEYLRPIELWRGAVEARPDNARAHSNLAHALQESGDVNGGIDEYRAAFQLEPTATAHMNLGAALSDAGRLDEAVRLLEFAVAAAPDDARFRYNLAVAYERAGRRANAESAYRRTLDEEPAFAPALLNLAGLVTPHHPGEAIDLFLRAAEAEPSWPQPRGGAAWLLATNADPAQRDPERAVQLAEDAVALGGRQALWLETLAVAQRAAGRPEARATLDEALGAARREGNGGAVARLERLARDW